MKLPEPQRNKFDPAKVSCLVCRMFNRYPVLLDIQMIALGYHSVSARLQCHCSKSLLKQALTGH